MSEEEPKEILKFDAMKFGKFNLNQENSRRMKLYIKLTGDESKRWGQLKTAMVGDSMSDDTFARILFFKGIDTITREINDRIMSMTEEEKKAMLESVTDEDVNELLKVADEELSPGADTVTPPSFVR